MNEIKIKVNFEEHTCDYSGLDVVQNDYNSTKLIFKFDDVEGTKIFELKNPNNEVVFVKEIENNQIVLVGYDEDDNVCSLFNTFGDYIFEISLYGENNISKLTSAYGVISVSEEQVKIGDEIVTPQLPIFEQLINRINEKINETNNLDIEATKSDDILTITITKKDGSKQTINMIDGTVDYEDLNNKPSINGVELSGNKLSSDLDLVDVNDYDNDLEEIHGDIDDLGSEVDSLDLNKQDNLTAGDNITIENNVISALAGIHITVEDGKLVITQ